MILILLSKRMGDLGSKGHDTSPPHGLKSLLCLLPAVWPQACYLTSLSLNILISKMRIMGLPWWRSG